MAGLCAVAAADNGVLPPFKAMSWNESPKKGTRPVFLLKLLALKNVPYINDGEKK